MRQERVGLHGCSLHLTRLYSYLSVRPVVKRNTVSLYDTKGSHFVTEPIGPFEDPNVHDQPTAQEHFTSNREIKLKDPRGDPLPNPSYRLVGGGHHVGHADVGIRKGRVIAPEARRCHDETGNSFAYILWKESYGNLVTVHSCMPLQRSLSTPCLPREREGPGTQPRNLPLYCSDGAHGPIL